MFSSGRRRHHRDWYDSEDRYYGHYNSDSEDEEDDDEDERSDPSWPFSSIGAADEILIPQGEIYREMSTLLGKAQQGEEAKYSFGDQAKMLSGLPGLGVKGGGMISLPIRRENAVEIETRGKQVRDHVWMLTHDQVEVKNQEWIGGIQNLCKLSAEKLGFKDIALRLVLDKLLLYGEGGHFEKQQDSVGGHCVARLLVQLPSVCTGGDLVVAEEGAQKQSVYKFGKEERETSQFVPYYVVYTAGAHRAVEKVTSGYCLVLLFSLCLPRGMSPLHGKNPGQLQRIQLAETIKKLSEVQGRVQVKRENGAASRIDGENDTSEDVVVALMLSRAVEKYKIETRGVEALTGADLNRCQLFTAANALVPREKQLKLCVARL